METRRNAGGKGAIGECVGGIGLPGRWRWNTGPWRLGGKLEERVPLGSVLEELGSLDGGGGTRVLGDWEESWRKGCHWGVCWRNWAPWTVEVEHGSLETGRKAGGKGAIGECVGGIGLPGRWRWNTGPWRLGGKLEKRVPLGEGVLEELGSLDDGGGKRVFGDWEKGCHWRRGEFMDLNPVQEGMEDSSSLGDGAGAARGRGLKK